MPHVTTCTALAACCLALAVTAAPSAQPPRWGVRAVAPPSRLAGAATVEPEPGGKFVRLIGPVVGVGTDWDDLHTAGFSGNIWQSPAYACLVLRGARGEDLLCFFQPAPGQKREVRKLRSGADWVIVLDPPPPPPEGRLTTVRPGDRVCIRGRRMTDHPHADGRVGILYDDCELVLHRPGR